MRKAILVVLVAVCAMAAFIGYRWYNYVTNTTSPFEEVGIEINSRMPGPIKNWGCGKLKQNFPNALPPYGCADATGKNWAVK